MEFYYPRVRILQKDKKDKDLMEIFVGKIEQPTANIHCSRPFIAIRHDINSELNNKGFYLSKNWNWIIVTDNLDRLVLLAIRK